jgi:hypothetical protein
VGHNSAPGSRDTGTVALRPGGGLDLTTEAHARSEGQLAREKNLESRMRGAFQPSTGLSTGVTRPHRGGSDGLGAGWLAGLAPFQLLSGASLCNKAEVIVQDR